MGNLSNTPASVTLSTVAQWYKVTVPYTAVQTAGLLKQVTLFTLPAKSVVHATYGYVTQAFVGTLIATCTASFGPAGSPLKYGIAGTVATINMSIPGLSIVTAPESMAGTTVIVAQFVSTIANLSALTAGSADFYFYVSSLE